MGVLKPEYILKMHERIKIGYHQNDWQDLKYIWTSWDSTKKESFTKRYKDIALLLQVLLDISLLQAISQFLNPVCRCFTFNHKDLTPTVEEYTSLLNIGRAKTDRIYCKALNPPTFKKRLA